jgi:FHA domain
MPVRLVRSTADVKAPRHLSYACCLPKYSCERCSSVADRHSSLIRTGPAHKRSRDGGEAAEPGAKSARAPARGASGVRAALEVDISKSGRSVGHLALPELRPHQRCTFGRGADADVKLEHASLSRLHAELAVNLDGVLTLTDLSSGAICSAEGTPAGPEPRSRASVGKGCIHHALDQKQFASARLFHVHGHKHDVSEALCMQRMGRTWTASG